MKKRELILGAIALTGTVSSMVSSQVAFAGLGCNNPTTSATALSCTGTTAGTTFIAEAFSFTGSNGVNMGTSDGTTGVALCGTHISGNNRYGLTTAGGSMTSKTGTGTGTNSGGCS